MHAYYTTSVVLRINLGAQHNFGLCGFAIITMADNTRRWRRQVSLNCSGSFFCMYSITQVTGVCVYAHSVFWYVCNTHYVYTIYRNGGEVMTTC